MKATKVNFDANAFRLALTKRLVDEQTRRLAAYAEKTIQEIGRKINSYAGGNHMDRTGNLLNSLCWGVAYNNELKANGFYRDANALSLSYLHERYEEHVAYPVDGHALADQYTRMYGRLGSGGGVWRVWFAVLAPYWGYWEKGFVMTHGFSNNKGKSKIIGATFKQFAVMSQFYDKISRDLKPANVSYKVKLTPYSKQSMHRDFKHRVDNPYSRFNKKWMSDKRYNK